MSDAPKAGFKADAVLLGITAFWGVTFVVVKDALDHADAFTWIALRFAVGAAVLTVVARRELFDRETFRRGAILAFFLFTGFATQTWGLAYTTPSRSAFITGLAVMMVPFVSIAVFRRAPKPPAIAGVALAVFGLWFLTGGVSGEIGRGDVLTFLCAVAFAAHITLVEKYAPGRPLAALVGVQLWLSALLSALCIPFTTAKLSPTPGFVAAVLFCGVVASALAIVLQTWGQARTTAVRAALIYSLEPVFAAAFSVAMGREELGRREVLGGALIVAGVLVGEVGSAVLQRIKKAPA